MPDVYVGAGSNADPERRLRFAAAELERRFGALRASHVYRSAAAGVPGADYLNAVFAFRTDAGVDAVRAELRAIEAAAGRTRADPAVCELDLDLLLYGARVAPEERLPRSGILTQPFVLIPLATLAPEHEDPLTGECYGAAARALTLPPGALVDLGPLAGLGS
jgi:2-amino-4-hydroxy-6-hydroxymethyldihydropteridine diphosphokinase